MKEKICPSEQTHLHLLVLKVLQNSQTCFCCVFPWCKIDQTRKSASVFCCLLCLHALNANHNLTKTNPFYLKMQSIVEALQSNHSLMLVLLLYLAIFIYLFLVKCYRAVCVFVTENLIQVMVKWLQCQGLYILEHIILNDRNKSIHHYAMVKIKQLDSNFLN